MSTTQSQQADPHADDDRQHRRDLDQADCHPRRIPAKVGVGSIVRGPATRAGGSFSARSRASPAVPSLPPGWPALECRATACPPGRPVVPFAPVAFAARFVGPLCALLPEGRGRATAELKLLTQPVVSLRGATEHGYTPSQLGVIGYHESPIRCPSDALDDCVVCAASSRMNHGKPARLADCGEAHGRVCVEEDEYLDRRREQPAKGSGVDVVGYGLVQRTPLIRAINQNTSTAR